MNVIRCVSYWKERNHAPPPIDDAVPRRAADAQARGVRGFRARHPRPVVVEETGRLGLSALLGRLLRLQPRAHRGGRSRRSATPLGVRGTPSSSTSRLPPSRPTASRASGSSPRSATAARTGSPDRPATRVELFWDVERAVVPPGEESPYPERPQRNGSRGCRVRILDHVTVTAPDVKAALEWHRDALDFRIMGAVASWLPGAPPWFFGTATQNEKSHDFGFIHDFDGTPGAAAPRRVLGSQTNHELTEGARVHHRARPRRSTTARVSTASASRTTCTSATPRACATS